MARPFLTAGFALALVVLFLTFQRNPGQEVLASYLQHWRSTVPGIQQVIQAGKNNGDSSYDITSSQASASPTGAQSTGTLSSQAYGSAPEGDGQYLIGVGKADITGPVVEINLMGYADPAQVGTGLRQRLYSRAFIVADKDILSQRFLYLVLDTQSGDTAITHGILEGITRLGTEYEVYNRSNVAVTGTHSHSGPGAWLNYLLPQITSRGFNKQSYEAIVNGTLLSIRRAHESLGPGKLSFGWIENESSSELNYTANINRSLYAYLANPAEERGRYQHSVDKTLTMLRFQRVTNNEDIGVLTWFPVHGTSMLGNNTLISGDNKGVAAYLFEKQMIAKRGENTSALISENFVAGFSQANVGDTSPNIMGAYCEDGSGEECTFKDSLCGGKNEPCHGRGPFYGLDDSGQKSCFEIGQRQAQLASALFQRMFNRREGSKVFGWMPITGQVGSLHTYKDFSNFTFSHPNGSTVRTCAAALGYSFAAGTTDGPGAFDFKQNNPGDPKANPIWGIVRNLLHTPSKEQIACQAPKPILLDAGETTKPYLWAPNVVDIQMLRVGPLLIIVSPGEATTMAGRRWKSAIASEASRIALTNAEHEPVVVLGGPANSYTHYITTEEEYSIQRYEGASTLYGPHTLNAYIKLTTELLPYLSPSNAPKVHLQPGPQPPIHTNSSLSLITPVIMDAAGFFRSFGDVTTDVDPPSSRTYNVGEKISVAFIGANPRNNLRLEGTFAAIEKFNEDSQVFEAVRNDEDWDLIYHWKRTSEILGTSEVTLTWEIGPISGETQMGGRYRFKYYGDSKPLVGTIKPFVGTSGEFQVAD